MHSHSTLVRALQFTRQLCPIAGSNVATVHFIPWVCSYRVPQFIASCPGHSGFSQRFHPVIPPEVNITVKKIMIYSSLIQRLPAQVMASQSLLEAAIHRFKVALRSGARNSFRKTRRISAHYWRMPSVSFYNVYYYNTRACTWTLRTLRTTWEPTNSRNYLGVCTIHTETQDVLTIEVSFFNSIL